MVRTEELHKILNPKFSKWVTKDENGNIPIFGDQTSEVAGALYTRSVRETGDEALMRAPYFSIAGFYAKIGAYIASTMKEGGVLYEVGCGLAIPSITYSKITNNWAAAIDNNRREIKGARYLAERVNANNIDFIVCNGADIIEGKSSWFPWKDYSNTITPQDTVLVLNPVDDHMDQILTNSNASNVIFVGGPGRLFGRHNHHTSSFSGPREWIPWFIEQGLDKSLEAKGWNDILISGEYQDFFMPNMALVHLSR